MIVRALNRLLAEKLDGIEWVEKAVEMPKCKKHPKWAMKAAPKTKKDTEGCICHDIWAAKENMEPEYEPVITDELKFFGNEVVQEVVRQLYKFPDELKTEKKENERSFLSASKVGQCVYKNCLDKLGAKPEPLSVRGKLTFMFGGILESLYRYLLRTCELEGFRFIEVPELQSVNIGGEDQRGYYDGIIEAHWKLLYQWVGGSEEFWSDLVKKLGKEHFRILFEMKTKSDYGFKDAVRTKTIGMKKKRGSSELISDDPFGYRAQMGFYLRQAYKDGLIDIPLGCWFIVSKNTGAAIDLPVALKQLEGDIAEAEKNFAVVADVVRNNKPLPARPWNLTRDGHIPKFPCGYCDYKWACWSDEPIKEFKIKDVDAEKVFFEPVYENEPTMWLEQGFDGRGQPLFFCMEAGGNDDD